MFLIAVRHHAAVLGKLHRSARSALARNEAKKRCFSVSPRKRPVLILIIRRLFAEE